MYFTLLLQGRTPLLIRRWRLGWIYHDLRCKDLKCVSNRLNIRPWTPHKISDRPCPRQQWRTSRGSRCPARVPADSALSGKIPASIKSYFSVCTSLPAFRETVIIVESREQWRCEILKSCVNTRGHLILSGQLGDTSVKKMKKSKKGKNASTMRLPVGWERFCTAQNFEHFLMEFCLFQRLILSQFSEDKMTKVRKINQSISEQRIGW